jgi:alkanesulfonate monooxygenase SsuD/methylene tetrahydromethanopterin reductase-like flavin-dependent oxidoreductase (luciferase family)
MHAALRRERLLQIGIYTFADITPDWRTGAAISVERRYAEVLAAAKLADEAGLEIFGVGEHHRLDLPISSPAPVMAAIAAVTKRIRVTSAVTILSTLDPVRVFQDFATADVISGGRAEVIVGRGAFLESFPLFGHDLNDYDALFAEKLDLLMQLTRAERITWQGRFRPSVADAEISPRPVQSELPIWMGVGGNPKSAATAARLGLPLTLANISLPPASLAPQVADYRRIGVAAGHDPARLKVALAGHMHINQESRVARDEFYPYYNKYFRLRASKTYAKNIPREEYEQRAAADGPLFVGSPQEIIDKLCWERELFKQDRYLAQIDIGGLPFAKVAKTIELLGEKVVPALK